MRGREWKFASDGEFRWEMRVKIDTVLSLGSEELWVAPDGQGGALACWYAIEDYSLWNRPNYRSSRDARPRSKSGRENNSGRARSSALSHW